MREGRGCGNEGDTDVRSAVNHSNRIDGMGCWRQGRSGNWGHSWPLQWAPGPDVFFCLSQGRQGAGQSWGIRMNSTLDMWACGCIRNTRIYGMVSSWTPCNGFHTLFSYLSKVHKSRKQTLHVHCVFLLEKLFIEAGISWLDCFVKKNFDHQGEVTKA